MGRDAKQPTLGLLPNRDGSPAGAESPVPQDRFEQPSAQVDADDVAFAMRVLNDPATEWIDWDDAKRELAGKGD